MTTETSGTTFDAVPDFAPTPEERKPVDLSQLVKQSPASLNPQNITNPDLIGQPENPSIGGAAPEIYGPLPPKATTLEEIATHFKHSNSIATLASTKTISEALWPSPDPIQLTPEEIIKRTEQDGLRDNLDAFVGVTNDREYEAVASDINRSTQDKRIMQMSGITTGTIGTVLGFVFDPLSYIPLAGGGLKLANASQVLVKSANAGAHLGQTTLLQQPFLAKADPTRTVGDATHDVVGAIVMGAALNPLFSMAGTGLSKILGSGAKEAALETKMGEFVEDFVRGGPKASAAGAAFTKEYVNLKSELLDSTALHSTMGFGFINKGVDAISEGLARRSATKEATAALERAKADVAAGRVGADAALEAAQSRFDQFGDVIFDKPPPANLGFGSLNGIWGKFTEGYGKLQNEVLLGNPRLDIGTSHLFEARQFGRMFYSEPGITKANAQGRVNMEGLTVEDYVGQNTGKLAEFKNDVRKTYAANRKDYKSERDLAEKAYYAVVEGKPPANAAEAVVAQSYRRNISEYLHEGHVKNGRLPEDTAVMGSDGGYVTRMYNREALRADKPTAMTLLTNWAKNTITKETEKAYEESGYVSALKANTEAKASFAERKAKREANYEQDLTEWTAAKEKAEAESAANHKDALNRWASAKAEWEADQAGRTRDYGPKPLKKNFPVAEDFTAALGKWETARSAFEDGSKRTYGKKPVKSDYEIEVGPKPTKGEVETLTDGNPIPAHPRNVVRSAFVEDGQVITDAAFINREADRLAQEVYETLSNTRAPTNGVASRVGIRSGYLKGRVVDVQDAELARNFFLKTNLLEIAEHQMKTSGFDMAMGNVFKTQKRVQLPDGTYETKQIGDYEGTSVIDAIIKEADGRIKDPNTTGAELTRLVAARDRMIAGIQNEMAIARGSFANHTGLLSRENVRIVSNLNYARVLTGVTVSALGDPVNIVMAHGIGDTFKYGLLPLLKNFREAIGRDGAMREQGIRTGNVVEMLHNSRVAELTDNNNPFKDRGKFSVVSQRLADLGTHLSLISHWTDFGKQVAHNITSGRLIDAANKGFDALSAQEKAWVSNLGLTPKALEDVKAAYGAQQTKEIACVPWADLENWDADLAAQFGAAFRREGKNNVIVPGLGDKPQFFSTPSGALVMQFKSFMLSNQLRLIARQAQLANVGESATQRAAQQAAFLGGGLGTLAIAHVFVDALKRSLSDNEVDTDKFFKRWEQNPGGSAYDALDKASIFGPLFDASNMVGKFLPTMNIQKRNAARGR